ncbi:SIS domain-containing protein [Candidatus Pelagibacter sp.]|jgi:D-sedoheptulose 7-phosphate isomerase|nr:SIS domain-containing protein [Candidatus Pelagibacter sp.]
MKKNTNNFINTYINNLYKTLQNIDQTKLIKCKSLILNKIKNNKNIYVCGNGGASSISNHLLCDFNKNIKNSSKGNNLKPKVISFSSNTDLLTAIANDISYDNIFSHQLENFARKGDLLILFSCSGTSKNIIKVAQFAKIKKIEIISFTAFKRLSKLEALSKIFMNLNINNYGIAEDVFQSIMHIISQMIRVENSYKKIKIL